ncbi:MAG: hypothetical protein ACFFD4_31695 [Candidatus Odinarchaeota archaeon]
MTSVMMWWGQTSYWGDALSHGLSASFGPNGIELRHGVTGPGCGNYNCGREHTYFYSRATYHLSPPRMPEGGCKFESRPITEFSGCLEGHTLDGAWFDDPDAKFGYRLRQYVYVGGTYFGMTEQKNPRQINIEGEENEFDIFTFPNSRTHPAFTFFLDRGKDLEIDIEIRFSLNVEGTGRLEFLGSSNYFTQDNPLLWNSFYMNTPQWSIQSVD